MTFWILLWKGLFLGAVTLFAGMAVWVTLGGWIDIRHLLRDLRKKQPQDEEDVSDP